MAGPQPANEEAVTDAKLTTAVLDASALTAFMFEEDGFRRVRAAIARGALISAVNWAETLADMAERGEAIDAAEPRARHSVAKTGTLEILGFDAAQAIETARLRLRTRPLGLSLADRACLALGRLYRVPVLTTDRAWRSLHISVKIEVIR